MTYETYKTQILKDPRSSKLNFDIDGRLHFVYRITHIFNLEYYYGSHSPKKGNKKQPKDIIGVTYFSSSKNKEFLKDQKDNPQNYKYKVIKIFDNSADKMIYEAYLHQYFDVKLHENFYNGANQTPFGFDTTGKAFNIGHIVTEDTREKLRAFNTGKKYSTERIINMTGENAPFYGRTHSDDTKKKQSESQKGLKIGIKLSEEHKKKIGDTQRGIPTVPHKTGKCPICGEIMNVPNLERWHGKLGEKCKSSKKHKVMSSIKKVKINPNAKVIIIFDGEDNERFSCHGDFRAICKYNNLPYDSLYNSYHSNSTKLYIKGSPHNKEWYKYKGWYAKEIK